MSFLSQAKNKLYRSKSLFPISRFQFSDCTYWYLLDLALTSIKRQLWIHFERSSNRLQADSISDCSKLSQITVTQAPQPSLVPGMTSRSRWRENLTTHGLFHPSPRIMCRNKGRVQKLSLVWNVHWWKGDPPPWEPFFVTVFFWFLEEKKVEVWKRVVKLFCKKISFLMMASLSTDLNIFLIQ